MSIIRRFTALVQHYAPETNVADRISAACNDSWRVDETSMKIKRVWMYLYRAVDLEGNTLEFLLSPTRDAEAAKRFFCKALHVTASPLPQAPRIEEQVEEPTTPADPTTLTPRVINVDKNAADPKAIAEFKATRILPASVELKPDEIPQQSDRTRPSLYQAVGQARDGILFVEDRVANVTRI